MIKKIFCFLCCTVILVLSCSSAFLSSAVVSEISLPFPQPLEFGGDDCGAVVWYASNTSSYAYYMAVLVPTAIEIGVNGGFDWFFTGTSNSVSIHLATSSNTVAAYTLYLFSWSNNASSFSVSIKSSAALSANSSKDVTIKSSSITTYENFMPYGKQLNSSYSDTALNVRYLFNGQVNQVDIDNIYSRVNSINSSTTTIKNDVSSIKGDVSSINGSVSSIKDDTGSIKNDVSDISSNVVSIVDNTNSIYSELNNTNFYINLYCSQIVEKLDKLLELQGYEEPSETTTNSAVSDLDKAEQALHKDSFEQLNSFEVPEFSSNAQSFGSGFVNAVQFLSSNMEFLSGNKVSSYNSSNDNTLDNSMRKISTLVFVVLTIGLVSFVLNLVSSKGSD